MTGAMNAAISGLKNHMQKLNVIGNNIANVNTFGYKSGRVVFQDAMYSTTTAGSNGTATVGGRNPSQIGYGVKIGSIDLDFGTSSLFTTGRALDCMIDGDGFFLVGDKGITFDPNDPESLKSLTLTRVGDFDFKADGYLSDSSGSVVYGFLNMGTVSVEKVDENGDPILDDKGNPIMIQKPVFSDQLVPIRLPKVATVKIEDPNDPDKFTYEKRLVYPTDGRITVDPATGEATVDPDATAGQLVYDVPLGAGETLIGEPEDAILSSVSIDPKTGLITAEVDQTDQQIVLGALAIGSVTNSAGVTHTGGPYYAAGEGAGQLKVTLFGGLAEQLGIDFIGGSTLGPDGTPSSGMAIENKKGVLQTGGLEMSKTDLAAEIAEMITTQRGYQANTRIITVTDGMLEELVNMKR